MLKSHAHFIWADWVQIWLPKWQHDHWWAGPVELFTTNWESSCASARGSIESMTGYWNVTSTIYHCKGDGDDEHRGEATINVAKSTRTHTMIEESTNVTVSNSDNDIHLVGVTSPRLTCRMPNRAEMEIERSLSLSMSLLFLLFCSLWFFSSLDLGPVQMALAQVFTTSRDKSSGGGVSTCTGSGKWLPFGTDQFQNLWVRTFVHVGWLFHCILSFPTLVWVLCSAGGLHLKSGIMYRHGCTWRVQGRVTFALYSQLSTSLRSLPIILPSYYSTILTSMCATVSTDIPSYQAIHECIPLQNLQCHVCCHVSNTQGEVMRSHKSAVSDFWNTLPAHLNITCPEPGIPRFL